MLPGVGRIGRIGAPGEGVGAPSLFEQMLVANPSLLFSAARDDACFQERTGASATTASAVDQTVGSFKNFGSLGGWAVAPSDAARPVRRLVSGKHRLASDGIDDVLRILFTQSQPFVRVMSIGIISVPPAGQIAGGGSANSAALYKQSPSGNLSIFSGTELPSASFPSGVVVTEERHSGATSRHRVNAGSYTTGNAGTTVSGGMSFGPASGATFAAVGYYACVCWVGSEPSADDLALARAFCADAAGVTL